MDYELRHVSKTCTATGQPLVGGELCWSVLSEVNGKLIRQDYSSQAWSGPPEGCLGYWQCLVPPENAAAQRKIDVDGLFQYFVQLCESPNIVEQNYQYVLALLLLRKRRLILEDSIQIDDQPAMRLAGSGGEGPFEVMERDLTDAQVVELQEQFFGNKNRMAA